MSSVVAAHWLSCSAARGNLPGPGLEPVSPAFAGRFFFFNFEFYLFIYLFIYGCVGSSFLCEGVLQSWQVGASHHRGLSCCGAQAPDAQAQQLWPMGPAAPRHVGSSQTRVRTRVPALAGRFSTTAPPGKPQPSAFNKKFPGDTSVQSG